jgi:hypothetical protein
MKRDMDLARKIMLAMESDDYDGMSITVDGYSKEQIGFHAYLLSQAGLITSIDVTTMGNSHPVHMPHVLTWDGYEFLGSVADPGNWEKAKALIKPAGGMVFSVVKDLALAEIKAKLGIP